MVKNSKEPKKRGLGRGLEALFDESPQVQETEEITEISFARESYTWEPRDFGAYSVIGLP